MSNSLEIINISVINELKEIMGDDFCFLINKYQADSEDKISEMKSAFNSKDVDTFKMIVHSLKGSSLNIGMHKLAYVASQIEDRVSSENIESLHELLSLLEYEFSSAKEAIAQLMR